MKLVSFVNPLTHKKTWGKVREKHVFDLGSKLSYSDIKAVIEGNAYAEIQQTSEGVPLFPVDDVQFLPVIENPGKIFCVGMNYLEKRLEFDEKNNAPTLFIRFADSLTAHKGPLCKPEITEEFDYEGELAVIIGKYADNVSREEALSHVAGYSCFMDGSVRDFQFTWFTSGKNWRKTGAFGPWMVTSDELPDPQTSTLSTWLNGQRMQHDNTKNMMYPIDFLIEYISRFSPLSPGDVIITGSPGGVGKKRNPPVFMKEGDVIEVEIDTIGRLTNTVTSLSKVFPTS